MHHTRSCPRPLLAAAMAMLLAGAFWGGVPWPARAAQSLAPVTLNTFKQTLPASNQGLAKPHDTARAQPVTPLAQQAVNTALPRALHWGWLAAGGAGIVLVLGGLGVRVVQGGLRHGAAGGAQAFAVATPPVPQQPNARHTARHTRQRAATEELVLGGESLIPGIARALAQVPLALAATQPMLTVRAATLSVKAHHSGAPAHTATQEIDPSTFLREAKALFMRLTTASSTQDQAELFCLVMPEALQDLQPHIAPAGPDAQGVNFLTLDAQLLRAHKSSSSLTVADQAEVRFRGLYSTAQQATASAFDCVWSLVFDRGIWRLHGIQAL